MGQLTIYLDDETLEKVKRGAEIEGDSVSSWIRRRLEKEIEGDWPPKYFELFGKLEGTDLERPRQPAPENDVEREGI